MHVKDASYKILHQLFLSSSPQYRMLLTFPERDGLCTHVPSGRKAFNFLLGHVMFVSIKSNSKDNSWEAAPLADPRLLFTLCYQSCLCFLSKYNCHTVLY